MDRLTRLNAGVVADAMGKMMSENKSYLDILEYLSNMYSQNVIDFDMYTILSNVLNHHNI